MEQQCPQISHLAGSATDKLPGTAKGSSPKAPCQRERRLKLQTHSLLSRSESFSTHAQLLKQTNDAWDYVAAPGVFGVVRTDTQALARVVVSKQYEIVQNDSLLRMAEFIREEVDMDCVIVLSDGAKVCFTATLRGAETDIVPGDTVKRRIVGYLGHDGKTGCGAKFTNIRVVCQNTLTAAMQDSGARSSITHKNGANNNFDALISSIDVARQDFVTECDLMREFSRASMGLNSFREFVDEVYNIDEGQVFRKRQKLDQAFMAGYGSDFAPNSIWSGINAITQVETSTRGTTAAKGRAQFARGTFGAGAQISKRAFKVAAELVGA